MARSEVFFRNCGSRVSGLLDLGGKRVRHLARINGSHHIYTLDGRIERLVISIHGEQTLKTGLQLRHSATNKQPI